MTKPFDMELFLAGMLNGFHATRQRHLRQANIIQTAIAERWCRKTPWAWQKKHVTWFLSHYLDKRSDATQYYYLLTVQLLTLRLERSWVFNH